MLASDLESGFAHEDRRPRERLARGPHAVDQRFHRSIRFEPTARFSTDSTRNDGDRCARSPRSPDDTPNDLALEAGRIDTSFAGHGELGALEMLVEGGRFGDHLEARREVRADRGQPAGESSGCAGAGDRRDVGPSSAEVLVGEALEPPFEQRHLGPRRAFLRRELGGRSDERCRHVARDDDVETTERPAKRVDRGEPTIRRGAPPDSDDDSPSTRTRRRRDQLSRPARARSQGIALGFGDQRETARARHLDDGGAVVETRPLRIDRPTEWPCDMRVTSRSSDRGTEHVQRPFAAVGQRQLDDLEPSIVQSGADRARGLGGCERAPELVGTRDREGHDE